MKPKKTAPPIKMEPLYTIDQVGAYLGVPTTTLARWRMEGGGPKFVKIGKRIAYRESSLREYLDANEHAITDPGWGDE